MLSIVLKKYFFERMNNSVYGKTMNNLRKKEKVRLVNYAKVYKNVSANQVLFRKRHLANNLMLFI